MATIIQERVELVAETGLASGAHNPNGAWCAMEAVAYIAGEKWSDHPECVCPVIGAFMRNWNDSLSNDERNQLITIDRLLKTVGPRGWDKLAERRSLMAADWLVRTHTPAWLRLAGLTAQADALSSLPEITAMAQVPSIREPLEAARRDASAARAAAGAAAGDAAGDAAGAKLAPTKTELQASAGELIERMCALTDDDLAKAA